MAQDKIWRIRDAVHNIIEFDGLDPLELCLWKCIQTAPFQRLRRIKQLGFSEFVYPGATHTRFAHSIGVFHTARRLIAVIKKFEKRNKVRYDDQLAAPALVAALLHDIGHGMFSHAFEKVGKEFGWEMAAHEDVSQKLIREGEIAEVLNRDYSSGFANNVAEILKGHKEKQLPANIFHAVISGQFDADRLDYMQRDRLMTGVGSSQVDMEWLFANLEVAEIDNIQDGEKDGTFQTLVLGAKAQQTAENYLFSLFHLYPTIYFHKTTCGFDVLFQALMRCMVHLVKENKIDETGLAETHPLILFIQEREQEKKEQKNIAENQKSKSLDSIIALDDNIFWGALPNLVQAQNGYLKKCGLAFKERRPLRAVDIKAEVEVKLNGKKQGDNGEERRNAVDAVCERVITGIKALQDGKSDWSILPDERPRSLYKEANKKELNYHLNQIFIHKGGNRFEDIRDISSAIRHAEPYHAYHAYIFRDGYEEENRGKIEEIIKKEVQNNA